MMNKAAFYKLSYGLYVISSSRGDHINGQIANTVFQVTSDPPTLGISINKLNLTHEFIKQSHAFSLSVLSQSASMEFIGRFGFKSGRDINKFEGIRFKREQSGPPVVLDFATATMEAEVTQEMDCGTHTIFLGHVTECEVLSDEEPMTYAYYHAVKGGKSPATAPTYQGEIKIITAQKEVGMQKYVCSVCGYVYDPEKGDPDSGIEPGTKFDDIPDNWVCPICGADKTNFSPEV